MSPSRRSSAILGLTAVVALTATACRLPDLPGAEPSSTSTLQIEDGERGAEQVTLVDGTELAIGADGPRSFVAQWREPGAEGWTEPDEIVGGLLLDGDDVGVVAEGETAVATFAWFDRFDDEQEDEERFDAAVCRDLECDAVVEDVVAEEPMISEDGEFAAIGLAHEQGAEDDAGEDSDGGDEGSISGTVRASTYELATWELGDDEWQSVIVAGPPDVTESFELPGVVLLDDGSFATVHGTPGDDGCRLELWTSEPRDVELTVAAATTSSGEGGCSPSDVTTDGSTVVGFRTAGGDETVTFSPAEDGGWTADVV